MKFFTSDQHFGHNGILSFMDRPYSGLDEMEDALIKAWNSTVEKGDDVYCLGDFSFYKKEEQVANILRRLNGQKFLVAGNHDWGKKKWGHLFTWVKDLASITYEEQHIVMCHYPLHTWNKSHYGSWMLHGHMHTKNPLQQLLRDGIRRFDVGVDGAKQYRPWSFEELKPLINTNKKQPYRHSEEK